jgi:hypothetical protein
MHVLRLFLKSGVQVELLYRGKDDVRSAVHILESDPTRVKLNDDFGKSLDVLVASIDGWQPSDYAAELEGALMVARAKQEASDKFQREMQKRGSLLVPGPVMQPPNGGIRIG